VASLTGPPPGYSRSVDGQRRSPGICSPGPRAHCAVQCLTERIRWSGTEERLRSPESRDDSRIDDYLIPGDETTLRQESFGDEDPVMHLRDLGQCPKLKDDCQSERDNAKVTSGSNAANHLRDICPDSPTFYGKDDLG